MRHGLSSLPRKRGDPSSTTCPDPGTQCFPCERGDRLLEPFRAELARSTSAPTTSTDAPPADEPVHRISLQQEDVYSFRLKVFAGQDRERIYDSGIVIGIHWLKPDP